MDYYGHGPEGHLGNCGAAVSCFVLIFSYLCWVMPGSRPEQHTLHTAPAPIQISCTFSLHEKYEKKSGLIYFGTLVLLISFLAMTCFIINKCRCESCSCVVFQFNEKSYSSGFKGAWFFFSLSVFAAFPSQSFRLSGLFLYSGHCL